MKKILPGSYLINKGIIRVIYLSFLHQCFKYLITPYFFLVDRCAGMSTRVRGRKSFPLGYDALITYITFISSVFSTQAIFRSFNIKTPISSYNNRP